MVKLLKKMSPSDIYETVQRYDPEVNLHDVFDNYRTSRYGLRLSLLGVVYFRNMGYPYKEFTYKPGNISHYRTLLIFERYCTYPYFVSSGMLALFDQEDSILFKLYGQNMDNWVEHMENNLPNP